MVSVMEGHDDDEDGDGDDDVDADVDVDSGVDVITCSYMIYIYIYICVWKAIELIIGGFFKGTIGILINRIMHFYDAPKTFKNSIM